MSLGSSETDWEVEFYSPPALAGVALVTICPLLEPPVFGTGARTCTLFSGSVKCVSVNTCCFLELSLSYSTCKMLYVQFNATHIEWHSAFERSST